MTAAAVMVASVLSLGLMSAGTANAADRYREVRAQHSSKCLDVTAANLADGAKVIQWSCWGGANQHWRLVNVGGGFYEVRAQHSNKCLDVTAASLADGANVIQWSCWGGANQHWRLAPRR
jgi:hypothetical protein